MSWDIASFKQKLESEHDFPGTYIFKFIVPAGQKDTVLSILPEGELSLRHSANQKYVSLTLRAQMPSSDGIVEVYQRAYVIEGIVAL